MGKPNAATENPWRFVSVDVDAQVARRKAGELSINPTGRKRRFRLWLANLGRMALRIGDHELTLEPGRMLLLPPYIAGSIDRHDPRCEMVEVRFDILIHGHPIEQPRNLDTRSGLILRHHGLPELALLASTDTLSIGERLLRARHIYSDPAMLHVELTGLIFRVIQFFRSAYVRHGEQIPLQPTPAQRAANYIYRNRENPKLRVEDVARHVGVSASHLARLFRKQFGLSVMHFTAQQRLVRARRLLHYPEFSISEIARLCGFRSPQYFSNRFRATHGFSPRQYRLSRLDQHEPDDAPEDVPGPPRGDRERTRSRPYAKGNGPNSRTLS